MSLANKSAGTHKLMRQYGYGHYPAWSWATPRASNDFKNEIAPPFERSVDVKGQRQGRPDLCLGHGEASLRALSLVSGYR